MIVAFQSAVFELIVTLLVLVTSVPSILLIAHN